MNAIAICPEMKEHGRHTYMCTVNSLILIMHALITYRHMHNNCKYIIYIWSSYAFPYNRMELYMPEYYSHFWLKQIH